LQPSYIYCKYCGHILPTLDGVEFPIDDPDMFDRLLAKARETVSCPGCGCRKWIRKAYYMV